MTVRQSDHVAVGEAPATVLEAFHQRARTDPDAVFLSTLDGVAWTFESVSRAVDDVTSTITAAERSPVIGAYGGNEPWSVVALLAAWSSGLCLACCGRQTPPDGARPLFEMEGCDTVLARDAEPFASGVWQAIQVDVSAEAMAATAGRSGQASVSLNLDDRACICFTSGTTGKPKAITLTHRHLVEQVGRMAASPGREASFRPRVKTGRPLISFSPFGHNGFFSWLGFALWLGRGLVLVDKFSVEAASDAVKQYAPSTLALTPAMIQMLATADATPELSSVKYVTSSTAPLAPDVKEQFTKRFGIPILQAYGMTELGNVAKEELQDVLEGRQPRGSVGRISPGREVRIVGDDGADAQPGTEGNVLVRPVGEVPSGVTLDDHGWFDTGDRGAFTPEGILTITGRSSDRIIVGGFNVSPAEVESELRRSGLVSDAVVVALPDERLGEVPVAGIVWSGADLGEELLASIRNRLAHYKLPRAVFSLEAVPRTVYGKVDRKAAAEMARRQLGEGGRSGMKDTADRSRAPGADAGSPSLLTEQVDRHVLRITLNRPHRLNAIDQATRSDLISLWQQVKQRSDVRCIVLTGTGSHAFCVGMDLKGLVADGGFPDVPEKLADHVGVNPLRNGVWTPLVVAVNGVCTGAGLQFVADADVVVASRTASFLDTHVSVGQVSALESIGLVHRIGVGRVLKMCLLGKNGRIGAEEALSIGLVDELVEPEALADRSLELARQLADVSPQAARFTKQAIRKSTELPQSAAEQFGWELLRRHRHHPDAMEGPRAFVEHRPPNWSDAESS